MISAEQFRLVMQATRALARPDLTWRVVTLAVSYLRQDTGEIAATREQLASDARASVQHISRVMSDLTRSSAILRHCRGQRTADFVNPTVGWKGGEGARQEAAKAASELRLVDRDSGPAAQ